MSSASIPIKLATVVAFNPVTIIEKALFNFDSIGDQNFKLSGTVAVSVSDAFTFANYAANPSLISRDVYTSLTSGATNWTAEQLANINQITSDFHNFIALDFLPVINFTGATPSDIASQTNINISIIYRRDLKISGQSAGGTDSNFQYPNSSSDIVLNLNGFGPYGLGNDETLDSSSFGFHTLMHEIGHSLGLAHPHSSIINGNATVTADYGATKNVGFDKLGFKIVTANDMNKEYFSIMSYDDVTSAGAYNTFAQTPMILDVIALQGAYGEGIGTTGSVNNTVMPGGSGGVSAYRTYFDTGGLDGVNLQNYQSGAYMHMGTTISGASHLVGVSMSLADQKIMASGGDPISLRWFYGEFENASGSEKADVIIGNSLDNSIFGGAGDDRLTGGSGNDSLDGGSGQDVAIFSSKIDQFKIHNHSSSAEWVITDTLGYEGTDTLRSIERIKFSDTSLAIDLDGNAGITAKILGAVFGKHSVNNKSYVGIGLNYLDAGWTYDNLAAFALDASGAKSSDQIVNLLWSNVFGIAPTDAQKSPYIKMLTDGMTAGALAHLAADTSFNAININLIGLAQMGIEYLPFN